MSSIAFGCQFSFNDDKSNESFQTTKSGCHDVSKVNTASFKGNGFTYLGLSTDSECGDAKVFQAAFVPENGTVVGGYGGKDSDIHKCYSVRLICG